jgi:hypothetical protein
MRFADLLGEPDDDGSAPGRPPRAEPGGTAPVSEPTGASGSFGGAGTTDEELARWFDPEEAAATDADPATGPSPNRASAIADATGAYAPSDAGGVPPDPERPDPEPIVGSPGGATRDDLLPARTASRGRRRR